MVFKTLRDVLVCAQQAHHTMSTFYSSNSEAMKDARVKIMMDYMSRHEDELEENLHRFGSKTAPKLLDTWFKNLPDSKALQGCDEIHFTADMKVDDVLEQALKFDHCLMNFYKMMSENCCISEIKEIFSNLAEMERIEKHKIVQRTMQLKEL